MIQNENPKMTKVTTTTGWFTVQEEGKEVMSVDLNSVIDPSEEDPSVGFVIMRVDPKGDGFVANGTVAGGGTAIITAMIGLLESLPERVRAEIMLKVSMGDMRRKLAAMDDDDDEDECDCDACRAARGESQPS